MRCGDLASSTTNNDRRRARAVTARSHQAEEQKAAALAEYEAMKEKMSGIASSVMARGPFKVSKRVGENDAIFGASSAAATPTSTTPTPRVSPLTAASPSPPPPPAVFPRAWIGSCPPYPLPPNARIFAHHRTINRTAVFSARAASSRAHGVGAVSVCGIWHLAGSVTTSQVLDLMRSEYADVPEKCDVNLPEVRRRGGAVSDPTRAQHRVAEPTASPRATRRQDHVARRRAEAARRRGRAIPRSLDEGRVRLGVARAWRRPGRGEGALFSPSRLERCAVARAAASDLWRCDGRRLRDDEF